MILSIAFSYPYIQNFKNLKLLSLRGTNISFLMIPFKIVMDQLLCNIRNFLLRY